LLPALLLRGRRRQNFADLTAVVYRLGDCAAKLLAAIFPALSAGE
jgi:hypothetical protein